MKTTGAAKRRSTWRSVSEHPCLAVLLWAALPVETAAAANLVLRVGNVDSTGGGVLGVGAAFAAMSLAFALAVIPAGVVVDRTSARRTFAVALTLRALPMLLGGILSLSGGLTTTAVVALAAGDGLAMALLRPSWQHFQASLVPEEAARDAAVLDDWIARAGALLGAAGGGLLVAVGLTGAGQVACALGFLPLLAAVARGLGAGLRPPRPDFDTAHTLRTAWSALRRVPRLREATRADVVLQLAVPAGVLAPAVTVAISAVDYLWLIALAAATGALAGMSFVTWAWRRVCHARLLRYSAAILVAVLVVEAVALSGGTPLTLSRLGAACLAVAAGEAAMTVMIGVTGAIVQADAPAHVRGAVTGLAQAPRHLATFASASALGLVMAWAGPAVALGALAVALLATVALLGGFRQLKGGARRKPQPVVSWSRRRASDLVSSRETCICEMPTRAAI